MSLTWVSCRCCQNTIAVPKDEKGRPSVCPQCGDDISDLIDSAAITPDGNANPLQSSQNSSGLTKTVTKQEAGIRSVRSRRPELPGYEILGELGRGGMGVVYQARQVQLQRLVALKMILGADSAEDAELGRFRTEAEAVARLQHPHVVQIFEVGEQDGMPYFSMEYVEGGSLAHMLDGTPLQALQAARLTEMLAQAMDYAHEHQIVHRDLKPANVLLTRNVEPKVSDFGLAKKLDADVGQTQSGTIVGTPSYMAPEQAMGITTGIGPLVDVYALGAILYELLTGRPPFKGATQMDTLIQVIGDDPVAPSRFQAKLPRDLETICLKCLQKEPSKRYASAGELAADLRRFQEGRAIQARPVGYVESLFKWCRRRPAVACLAGLCVLAGLTLIIGGIVYNRKLERALVDVASQRNIAQANANDARQQKDIAEHRTEQAQRSLYAAHMNLAQHAWDSGQTARCIELLYTHHAEKARTAQRRADFRSFEWYYLWRLCHHAEQVLPLPGTICAIRFAPDGIRLGGVNEARTVKQWSMPQGEELGIGTRTNINVWAAAFSADGKYFATGEADGMVRLWSADGRKEQASYKHPAQVNALAFSPNGRMLAVAGRGRTMRVLLAPELKPYVTMNGLPGNVRALAFSADNKLLATGGNDRIIRFWNMSKKEPAGEIAGLNHRISSLAFSPGGKRLVVGSNSISGKDVLRLYALPENRLIRTVQGHTLGIASVAFSPDGRTFASGSFDNTLRIWDAVAGKPIRAFKGYWKPVMAVAYSPDGKTIAGAANDVIKVWNLAADPEHAIARSPFKHINNATFSADGKRLAVFGAEEGLKLWEVNTPRPPLVLVPEDQDVNAAAFSPDGQWLAAGMDNGVIALFDARTGKRIGKHTKHKRDVSILAFSPDGSLLASSDSETLELWHAASGARKFRTKPPNLLWSAAFSPDGKLLATGRLDEIDLWDVGDEKVIGKLSGYRDFVKTLAFSPDGKTLAGGEAQDVLASEIKLWDVATQKLLATLRGTQGPVRALIFGLQGRCLVSTGGPLGMAEVRIWDPVQGQERIALKGPVDEVPAIMFSSNGRKLVAVDSSGNVITWVAASRQETLVPHPADAFMESIYQGIEEQHRARNRPKP